MKGTYQALLNMLTVEILFNLTYKTTSILAVDRYKKPHPILANVFIYFFHFYKNHSFLKVVL
jgi:hypothetical protein